MYTGPYRSRRFDCGYMGESSRPALPAPPSIHAQVATLKRQLAEQIAAKQAEIALLQAQIDVLAKLN